MENKLFSPFWIGNLKLKNRIVMAPMGTNFANDGGYVSSRLIDYLKRRAIGGAGLIYAESTYVEPLGVGRDKHLRIYAEEYLPGLRELTEAIHRERGLIGAQLNHNGREVRKNFIGTQPVAPSAIIAPWGGDQPRELTIPEIKQLVEKFERAALNAKSCEFDLIEIHAAHGYLVEQFLSPLTNKRTDEYGGDEYRRCRFALEIIEKIRSVLGEDFPLTLRLSVDEFWPGGLTLDESVKILQILAKAGLDAISISAGVRGSLERSIPQRTVSKGCYRHFSKQIREKLKIPVMVAGRINDPLIATDIIEKGDADLVVIGRGLLSDPDFPRKVEAGSIEEIRKCIGCNVCSDRLFSEQDIRCAVNPETGYEKNFESLVTRKRKKVLVVGGGPGGMEAARGCSLRGHEVTLWEKSSELGGMVALAAKVLPYKEDLLDLIKWHQKQLSRLPVRIFFHKEGTVQEIIGFGADFVILATGALPIALKGVEIDREAKVFYAEEVLKQGLQLEGKVGIIGGGSVGLELAEFLLERGSEVTIIEKLPSLGEGMDVLGKKVVLENIKKYPMQILLETEVSKIQKWKVTVKNKEGFRDLELDSVVVAIGYRPNNVLANEMSDAEKNKSKIKFAAIGDCVSARKIGDAIFEGAFTCISLNQVPVVEGPIENLTK